MVLEQSLGRCCYQLRVGPIHIALYIIDIQEFNRNTMMMLEGLCHKSDSQKKKILSRLHQRLNCCHGITIPVQRLQKSYLARIELLETSEDKTASGDGLS